MQFAVDGVDFLPQRVEFGGVHGALRDTTPGGGA